MRKLVTIVLLVAVLLGPGTSLAAETATFESFFRESSTASWYLAAGVAVLAGAAAFVFAPMVAPAVPAIGAWLGGLFGYSGVAATNFGLALLGGGAISAGGLGMAGGAAVLTAALSFTSDVVLDYSLSKATSTYKYEQFVVASRHLTNLPLPRNDDGPRAYEEAMKVLRGVSAKEPLSSAKNRGVIGQAIAAAEAVHEYDLDASEIARNESLLALLYFVTDDYQLARKHAHAASVAARDDGEPWPLPKFILATTLLYDERVDFANSLVLLRGAIEDEADNPLSPLLFSVYLDRMMFRFNDGAVTVENLNQVRQILTDVDLGEQWLPVGVVVLSRYNQRLFAEQQRVLSLTGTSNTAIRSSATTLATVRRSLCDYDRLLLNGRTLSHDVWSASSTDATDEIRVLWASLSEYSLDRPRLRSRVAALGSVQAASAGLQGAAKPSGPKCDVQYVVDEKLERLLKSAALDVVVRPEDGLFLTRLELPQGSHQWVWLESETDKIGTLDVRYLGSQSFQEDGKLSGKLASTLLDESWPAEMPAWWASNVEEGYRFVHLVTLIPANADSTTILKTIKAVATRADEKDQELMGADTF